MEKAVLHALPLLSEGEFVPVWDTQVLVQPCPTAGQAVPVVPPPPPPLPPALCTVG